MQVKEICQSNLCLFSMNIIMRVAVAVFVLVFERVALGSHDLMTVK